MKSDKKKPQQGKVEGKETSESKNALTAKMSPSPTMLPVYVLVASRKVTRDPGVVRLHVNASYQFSILARRVTHLHVNRPLKTNH